MRCARCGFDTTDLWAVLPVVTSLLQREGRVTYRALKREFGGDEAFLESLCEELIFAKRVARDEDGKVLVWAGETVVASDRLSVDSSSQLSTPQTADCGLRTLNPKHSTLGARLQMLLGRKPRDGS